MPNSQNQDSLVMHLDYDTWVPVPKGGEVKEGYIIMQYRGGWRMRELHQNKDGLLAVNAAAHGQNEIITLAFGDAWKGREATVMAMDYVNCDLMDFPDNTCMICDPERGPDAIYSPRLGREELEQWCAANKDRIIAFYEANMEAIESGEVVKMDPWWREQSA